MGGPDQVAAGGAVRASLTTMPTLTRALSHLNSFRYLCGVHAPHFSSKTLRLRSNCSCLRADPNMSKEADSWWWTNTSSATAIFNPDSETRQQ